MSDQEAPALPTLETLADDAAFLLSDDFDGEEYERFIEKSPAEKVRHFFCSSDCDAFAVALHRMTGWPIRALSSPDHGPVHRFVEAPDGRFLDAGGWTSLDGMKKRYGIRKALLTEPFGEEIASGYIEDDFFDGYESALGKAVAAIRQLPWAPFDEPEFREITARPVAGVDFPAFDDDADSEPTP